MLVNRILPPAGVTWLASDRQVFSAWCACISGDVSQADVLGEIISLGDRQSVAHNIGADNNPQAAKSQVVPLHDKLVMALRQLIEENTLPLNRNGAAGWRTGNKLWLVSKRVVDSMRLYLTQAGHTGIPNDNQRLFDVLQEHQLLEPCQDRAIWRTTVQGDNWAHELTLLCIPLIKIWPNPEAWPDEFAGSVNPKLGGDDDALQEQTVESSEDYAQLDIDKTDDTINSIQDGNNPNTPVTTAAHKPKPKKEKAPALEKSISQQFGSPTDNVGMQFLNWVVAGLQDRSLDYNNPGARVHVVAEGVLLVSPGIFQDFAKLHKGVDSWEAVQKKFLKLGLHERSEAGLNVHKYRISGANHSASIMSILLKDSGLLFKTGSPSPNPHVCKVKLI